ncbi:MAG: NUDIX domain-containing protein [Methanomassiliicoccaceae archaeon]|jgi:8-oxo-dGTP diphosphatase
MPYRLEYRTWLSDGDRRLLGEEEAGLLRLMMGGSLSVAAKAAGMSVPDAREMIESVGRACGADLVVFEGDTTRLTAEGERLLMEFESRRRRMDDQLRHMYRNPVFGVDGIVIQEGKVLLVRRGKEPFLGKHALPGGFMNVDETAEEAVVREVEEETGLVTEVLDLVGAYTMPGRDPRGHICTLAYRLVVRGGSLRAGDDAAGAAFFPLRSLPDLAFDHRRILEDAMRMYRLPLPGRTQSISLIEDVHSI